MGSANSKKRSADLPKSGHQVRIEVDPEDNVSFRDMEGPSFYCAYLGFSALPKPPTHLSVLQAPIKELYFKYRKTPASGRSANLKLVQNGVLVVLYENGAVKAELFFEFSSVTFVEAAKFVTVKTSSERKPKAMFVPVDESKGAVSDKTAFQVDKTFHFLVSSTHPPLVVCVVRRPTGVKALDCHVFALDTIENSLHISALIASAQSPTGQTNKMESLGDSGKGKPGFDKGARGDVIRVDQAEYSVYRGSSNYETPPSQRYSGGPLTETQPGQWYGGPGVNSPGRNGHMGPVPSGGIMLSQENFRDQPSPSQPYGGAPGQLYGGSPGQNYGAAPGQPYGGPPGQNYGAAPGQPYSGPPGQNYGGAPGPKGYGVYEQPGYGSPAGVGYLRQPDVVMHTRQRSGDGADHITHDRNSGGFNQLAEGGPRMRYDEVAMRNNTNNRLSGGPLTEGARLSGGPLTEGVRLSGGQLNRNSAGLGSPIGRLSPRPQELPPSGHVGGPHFSQWQADPASPVSSINSPRSPQVASPSVYDQRDFGPVYSASNLESRKPVPEPDDHAPSSRPVAKVPPHMIGVKVLPSDFRAVKLKPKTDKRPEAPDSDDYDNNKDVLRKYIETQEHGTPKNFNYPENDEIRDFPGRHDDQNRGAFTSSWNDPSRDHRTGRPGDSPNEIYRHGAPREYPSRYEDNNNKSRISAPVYADDGNPGRNWGQRGTHSAYESGGNRPVANDDPSKRAKDLEIENMFSNLRMQGGDGREMYRQPRDRNEIEEGLGYLP